MEAGSTEKQDSGKGEKMLRKLGKEKMASPKKRSRRKLYFVKDCSPDGNVIAFATGRPKNIEAFFAITGKGSVRLQEVNVVHVTGPVLCMARDAVKQLREAEEKLNSLGKRLK